MSAVVQTHLEDLLRKVQASTAKDDFIGRLAPKKLRIPYDSPEDGRRSSWKKMFRLISKRICNHKIDDEEKDCWFYQLMKKDSHYAIFKLGDQTGQGSQCKYQLHRVLFALLHPEFHPMMLKNPEAATRSTGMTCSHLCGKGFSVQKGHGAVCVNPHHIVLESMKANQQRKVCSAC